MKQKSKAISSSEVKKIVKPKKDRTNLIVKCFKTELILSEQDQLVLDGQSRIANWTYNQLLQASIDDYQNNN